MRRWLFVALLFLPRLLRSHFGRWLINYLLKNFLIERLINACRRSAAYILFRPTQATDKPSRLSLVELSEPVLPVHADPNGVGYSGQLMSWIDIAAGIAAKTHADAACVTASVDAVHFLQPLFVNEVAVLKAAVNRSWRTSMEVGVRVEAENMQTGQRRFCCHAFLTFVALGPTGEKTEVGAVQPETDLERSWFEQAEQRRQQRIQRKSGTKIPAEGPVHYLIDLAQHFRLYGINIPQKWPLTEPRPSRFSTAQTVQIIMPQHANSLGITFGGHIIRLMEQCAIISAHRHVHPPHHNPNNHHRESTGVKQHEKRNRDVWFRTASIDSLSFLRPTRVGDIVAVRAQVSRVWSSSMEIYISVFSHTFSYNQSLVNTLYPNDSTKRSLSPPPPSPSSNGKINHNLGTDWSLTNDGYLTVVAVHNDDGYHEERWQDEDNLQTAECESGISLPKPKKSSSTAVASTTRFAHNLPQVVPDGAVEQHRFEQALERRRQRLKERDALKQLQRSNGVDFAANIESANKTQATIDTLLPPMTAEQFMGAEEARFSF